MQKSLLEKEYNTTGKEILKPHTGTKKSITF